MTDENLKRVYSQAETLQRAAKNMISQEEFNRLRKIEEAAMTQIDDVKTADREWEARQSPARDWDDFDESRADEERNAGVHPVFRGMLNQFQAITGPLRPLRNGGRKYDTDSRTTCSA